MFIKCLGGFREVGRNAVLLDGKEKVLLEFGVEVETGETPLNPGRVDQLVLTHPHLDHSGSIPSLYKKRGPPLYATAATLDQAHLLHKDSIKVAKIKGRSPLFTEADIERMKSAENVITYGQAVEAGNARLSFFEAGHVPGSAMCIVEMDRKRIMYTGDFNTRSSNLLTGATVPKVDSVDVLLMESTYSSKDHPPRAEVEKKLQDLVSETIANKGIAVIPVFAVGRAAEVLLSLGKLVKKYNVYMDGMAREATGIALKYPELLRDPKMLEHALNDIRLIYNEDDRNKILNEPSVIITTGGCLEGGPIIHYLKRLYTRSECSLIFTGFQIPRTAGRYLMDTGRYVTEGVDLKVKMGMHFLDFSAHAGRSQLLKFVQDLSPRKVVCMHGDYCERFATELRGRFGIEAVAPKNGDVIKI